MYLVSQLLRKQSAQSAIQELDELVEHRDALILAYQMVSTSHTDYTMPFPWGNCSHYTKKCADNSAIVVLKTPTHTRIIIPGTNDVEDWLNNLDPGFTCQNDGIIQRRGYQRWLDNVSDGISIMQQIVAEARDANKKGLKFTLTGHSLGAAVALHAAMVLKTLDIPISSVFLYAAPLDMEAKGVRSLENHVSERLVNVFVQGDPVQDIGTSLLLPLVWYQLKNFKFPTVWFLGSLRSKVMLFDRADGTCGVVLVKSWRFLTAATWWIEKVQDVFARNEVKGAGQSHSLGSYGIERVS